MRTSRVAATHNSLFRDRAKNTIVTDEFQQSFHNNERSPYEQKGGLLQHKKQQGKKQRILKNSPHLVIKGMQYSADSVYIRNRLIIASQVVHYTSNVKSRLATYRNSI